MSGTGWQEDVQASEAAEFARYAEEFKQIQTKVKSNTQAPHILRAQHAKGVVSTKQAKFQIASNIPENLQVGVFQPSKTYDAIVRFSNANPTHRSDSEPDLRGVAFRIKSEEGIDHDFLMTNAPQHHAKTVREIMAVSKAFIDPSLLTQALAVITDGESPSGLLAGITAPITGAADKLAGVRRLFSELNEGWPIFERPLKLLEDAKSTKRILETLKAQTSGAVESLATETYYSRAPIAFGSVALGNNRVALKYRLAPESNASPQLPNSDLRDEFGKQLLQGNVRFRFEVQLFLDEGKSPNEGKTPIEDPTVVWDTPFTQLATLIIAGQEPDPNALEDIAFNPWNVDPSVFQPLGEFNRARRMVYPASASHRGSGT